MVNSINRGVGSVRRHAQSYGVRYVFLLTIIIVFVGAAGILNFERAAAHAHGQDGMETYGDALWWTAMMMTTIGSDYSPHTTAGRLLAVVIALYAIAIFGYITAILATLLIGKRPRA